MLPILYQNHNLILYSYPLFMGLAWGIGYQIYFSLIPEKSSRLKGQIYFWGIFVMAWLGAKVLFYLTYPKEKSVDLLTNVSFWTGGGFVFYGGFLGAMFFIFLMKLVDKKFSFQELWPMVPALVVGHGIGRIGCFLAGCCYGAETDLWWGVYMHDHYRHPTQLLEASGLLFMGWYFLKAKSSQLSLQSIYLIGYGVLRFIVEALRGDLVRGEWGPLTPSQWISCLLILAGLGLIITKNKRLAK